MKKNVLYIVLVFSLGLVAACSNSVLEYADESGDVAQETESSSSSAKIESSGEQTSEIVPPCKTDTEDNCEYGTVVDERDGQVYKTVKIGSQWWMAENTNYGSSYRDCCEGNDCLRAGSAYGRKEVQNACPAGWHLPTKAEFRKLIAMVGGDSAASRVLASSKKFGCERSDCPVGTDAYGFSAIWAWGSYYWGGERILERSFWSSSDASDTSFENDADADRYMHARYELNVGEDRTTVNLIGQEENFVYEFHARCIKNETEAPKITYGIVLPCASTSSTVKAERCRNSKEDNCEYGTLTDDRDGQVYKTVKIGEQWWMAENLNYAYLQPTDSLDSSSFCYKDSAAYCEKYGRLYLWSAAMDSAALYSTNGEGCGFSASCSPEFPVQGVCPVGWHVPSKDEWDTLYRATYPNGYYDPSYNEHDYEGEMLISGRDRFGFNAIDVGAGWAGNWTGYTSPIYSDNKVMRFWSSTIHPWRPDTSAYILPLRDNYYEDEAFKYDFLSVRCIKD